MRGGLSPRGGGGARGPLGAEDSHSLPPDTALQLNGLTKYEFGHACGDHGLEYAGTIVTRVASQARKLGVKPGWKIHVIDGHTISSDEDIFLRLQEAKWQWRSCYVWFVTDTAMIREEQARQRQEMIQAEMERLAELPFEGAHDKGHLIQLREGFTFQNYIEHLEDRAITLTQLQRVLKWSEAHCHRWRDAQPKGLSKTAGQKLNADILNMHHVNHWLIRAATKAKECSFVEMLAAQKQPANWFVVHWWGERLSDFVRCVELQASTRCMGERAGFWVGSFATRQHAVPDDSGDDPTKGFISAMAKAQYRVLLTLDGRTQLSGPATPFSRLWCNFEVFCCLEQPSSTLDIAACQDSKPTLITKDLTEQELGMERDNPGSGHKAKADRERTFDPEILQTGLSIKLQQAQVTEPLDRNRILNFIAGSDPAERNNTPSEDPELYARANRRLHAVLALTGWCRVMAVSNSDMQTFQQRLSDAIRSDGWCKYLDIGLAYVTHFEELRLDLKGTNLADDRLVNTIAPNLPTSLEELKVDLSQNANIANWGVKTFTEKLPVKVSAQTLILEGTGVTEELQTKATTLEGVRQHIHDEAQKGAVCTTTSLLPSANRRMVWHQEQSKC